MSWLDALVGDLRCAGCGTAYVRQDLHVVGESGGRLLVRCDCRACGREGIAVVLVEVATARMPFSARPRAPAITEDDVFEAHEILSAYTGNAEGLFEREPQGR